MTRHRGSESEGKREERFDASFRGALTAVGVLGGIGTLFAFVGWGGRPAFSVALGAAIAAANLYALARILAAVIGSPDPHETPSADPAKASAAAWGFLALLKMLVLFGGIYLLMSRHAVDPIGLLLGYGALPVGIAVGSVVRNTGARQ